MAWGLYWKTSFSEFNSLHFLSNSTHCLFRTNVNVYVGQVITKEVTESLHRFLSQVYVTLGRTLGKTVNDLSRTELPWFKSYCARLFFKQLLPLPPNHGAAVMDSTGRDKDRLLFEFWDDVRHSDGGSWGQICDCVQNTRSGKCCCALVKVILALLFTSTSPANFDAADRLSMS